MEKPAARESAHEPSSGSDKMMIPRFGRSFNLRLIEVMIALALLFFGAKAPAKTITISSRTTTSRDLPAVVGEAVSRLSQIHQGQSHRLVIQGKFKPLTTIKIQWWGEGELLVSGDCQLDGSGLPDGAETIFIAGTGITLEKVGVTNSRGHALVVGGKSDRYQIRNCSFGSCRQSAIHVWNDPHTVHPEKRVRGIISGNRISGFNLDKAKWANDGITVFDQGITISGNFISGSPTECNGIRAMGRDLLIERNVVAGVSQDDAGGIYLWGGPHASLFRGNVVRWNHIVGASRGIYLDDGTSGVRVEENVVEDSSVCAIFVSGGRDSLVQRNVIDRTPVFFHLDSRGLGWDSRPEYAALVKESATRLRKALGNEGVSEVLRKRYPGLRKLREGDLNWQLLGRPMANRVRDNFVRNAAENWELMDFSQAVRTDFRVQNKLSSPRLFGPGIDLPTVSLREQFGFREWDRLQTNSIGPSKQSQKK